MKAIDVLDALPYNQGPCEESLDWVKNRSVDSAWRNCRRPDWLLWALANVPHGKVSVPPRWLACVIAEELLALATRKGIDLPAHFDETTAKVKAWVERRGRYSTLAKIRKHYFTHPMFVLLDRDAPQYIAWLVEAITDVSIFALSYCGPPHKSSRGICQQTGYALLDLITCGFLTPRESVALCRLIRSYVPEFPLA